MALNFPGFALLRSGQARRQIQNDSDQQLTMRAFPVLDAKASI
jgi:hypothetical protein